MRLVISILLNGLMVFLASKLLSGVTVDGYMAAVIAGCVLGLVNFFVKPVITLITLPLTVITLGIFMLFVNGAMVLLADYLVGGFDVDGWGWAILFSLVLTLMNTLLSRYTISKKEK
ncbi:MAG: phage holin family protein [Bacteroidia bacterium]|nr:phage holin family protein [Bacteroidia bacterium]